MKQAALSQSPPSIYCHPQALLLQLLALLCCLTLSPLSSAAQEKDERPNSVMLFGAWMTSNNWKEIATIDDVKFRQTYLTGIALAHELISKPNWALEAEGQVVRHFGGNDHWEFNGALIGRWRSFPWDETLPTSIAFGMGPSLATEVPNEEVALDGESAAFLLYWVAEFEAGPADSSWSGLVRLHHRSNGYGLFAEDGGSNFIALGLRYRF